jgi:hypothetical protein
MDIILDSNIYLSDVRLKSNRFANFFDYVRRTRSSVILPGLVRDEVVQKHSQKLAAQLSRVEKEVRELQRYTMKDVTFHPPYPKGETNDLKALLRRPSQGIRTKFVAGTDGVDLNEVVRRGIKRVPPASATGEELRDVVLWLLVLARAKGTGRTTAFVTEDSGFWGADEPKPQILEDINSLGADLHLYRGLAEFTKENALVSEAATDAWTQAHLKGLDLHSLIEGPLRDALRKSRRVAGHVERITTISLQFVDGSVYKVDDKTDFAELRYRGSFAVEATSVQYRASPFWGAFPPGQGAGLGNLVRLADLMGPITPTGFGAASSEGERGDVQRSTYSVEAEVYLSCRIEDGKAEVEIDNVRLAEVAPR